MPAGPIAWRSWSAGRLANEGGVVSPTVTVNELLAGFPAASVALQLTVVLPIANMLPLA